VESYFPTGEFPVYELTSTGLPNFSIYGRLGASMRGTGIDYKVRTGELGKFSPSPEQAAMAYFEFVGANIPSIRGFNGLSVPEGDWSVFLSNAEAEFVTGKNNVFMAPLDIPARIEETSLSEYLDTDVNFPYYGPSGANVLVLRKIGENTGSEVGTYGPEWTSPSTGTGLWSRMRSAYNSAVESGYNRFYFDVRSGASSVIYSRQITTPTSVSSPTAWTDDWDGAAPLPKFVNAELAENITAEASFDSGVTWRQINTGKYLEHFGFSNRRASFADHSASGGDYATGAHSILFRFGPLDYDVDNDLAIVVVSGQGFGPIYHPELDSNTIFVDDENQVIISNNDELIIE
jgi:hypothetical protein